MRFRNVSYFTSMHIYLYILTIYTFIIIKKFISFCNFKLPKFLFKLKTIKLIKTPTPHVWA